MSDDKSLEYFFNNTVSDVDGLKRTIKTKNKLPSGAGTNGSVTLTLADTAYLVPATAPTEGYILILYNGSDADMFAGYQNTNANGILLPSGGTMSLDLGASSGIYVYCASASKVITYSYKLI